MTDEQNEMLRKAVQEEKKAFREFSRGVTFTIGVVALIGLGIAIISNFNPEPQPKFKVVDHYKQCDVVRYTDDTQRWHYFLDCSGGKNQ